MLAVAGVEGEVPRGNMSIRFPDVVRPAGRSATAPEQTVMGKITYVSSKS